MYIAFQELSCLEILGLQEGNMTNIMSETNVQKVVKLQILMSIRRPL
jgi:hypothetical protein